MASPGLSNFGFRLVCMTMTRMPWIVRALLTTRFFGPWLLGLPELGGPVLFDLLCRWLPPQTRCADLCASLQRVFLAEPCNPKFSALLCGDYATTLAIAAIRKIDERAAMHFAADRSDKSFLKIERFDLGHRLAKLNLRNFSACQLRLTDDASEMPVFVSGDAHLMAPPSIAAPLSDIARNAAMSEQDVDVKVCRPDHLGREAQARPMAAVPGKRSWKDLVAAESMATRLTTTVLAPGSG